MTAAEQLDLFAETQPEGPLYAVACCIWCGEPLEAVEIEGGPGAPWYAASLWCYLANLAHLREAHPERVPDIHRREATP